MTFDPREFQELHTRALNSIAFDEAIAAVHNFVPAIEQARELMDYTRQRYLEIAERTVEELERKRKSPPHLLVALRAYAQRDEVTSADHDLLDKWFVEVAYGGVEPFDEACCELMRDMRLKVPGFNLDQRLQDVGKRLRQQEGFAETGIDFARFGNSITGLGRVLRSLPTSPEESSAYLDRLGKAATLIKTKQSLPLAELAEEVLAAYEATILGCTSGRLGQEETYLLHFNLLNLANILETGQVSDERADGLLERVRRLSASFSRVRYLSSTTVYKTQFEPEIAALRVEADQTLDFESLDQSIQALNVRLQDSRRGTAGVNRLAREHAEMVRVAIAELHMLRNRRLNDREALSRECQRIAGDTASLEQRPSLTRRAVMRVQADIKLCMKWAEHTHRAHLRELIDLRRTCEQLWDSVDTRYAQFVESLTEALRQFESQIQALTDLRAAYHELRDLAAGIEDPDNGLRPKERALLSQILSTVKKDFYRRFNDTSEIDAAFGELDQRMANAAIRIRHALDIEGLKSDLDILVFRIGRGRFAPEDRRRFEDQVRRTRARTAGLQRKRGVYLAERAADQAALLRDLLAFIGEGKAAAQGRPGDPVTWETLLEVNKQVRAARILDESRRQQLQTELDEVFGLVRAERSRFAHAASMAFARYTDAIENIRQPLQRSSPRPTRDDAFEAIEQIKPLRSQIREEPYLLAVHRRELSAMLRTVSDAISEILDKASAEMDANLVDLRPRLEELEKRIDAIGRADQISEVIGEHKKLSREMRELPLSIEGRTQCRSEMEDLWARIAAKQLQFSRARFSKDRIDETLVRLEQMGRFLWMSGAPKIA